MYSAELGRFLQRDPAGYVDGLNLYAYVLNNPLRYTDPDGLMARATAQAAYDTVKFANDYIAAPIVNPFLDNIVSPVFNHVVMPKLETISSGIDKFDTFIYDHTGVTPDDRLANAVANTGSNPLFAADELLFGTMMGLKKLPKIVKEITKSGKYTVGDYNTLRKTAESGLDAHHVGQKAVMKKFINNYE